MRLYDTRGRKIVPFVAGHTVRMYVCGITPYDSTHLGHAFTYVVFDVLVRVLEARGHLVRYTRNVTDVDDDILRKARELGLDYQQLAAREMARFERELARLHLRVPDAEPRPTQMMNEIVRAVDGLTAQRSAYALPDGRVYFDTRGGEAFGALSELDAEQRLHEFAEKGGDPDAPGKRSPLDFLLWQPSAPGEPHWDSPWGPGRPGWHIECSVMAMETLGAAIDVHGGGCDLVFPHHEAEILQAEGLTGQQPFSRFWLHTGMVALDGVKMSKSLGNLVFVSDLLERYEAAAVRRYLLSHHYRQGWSHSDAELADAAGAVKAWEDAAGGPGRDPALTERFWAALDEDLDTPGAIAVLDALADSGAGASLSELAAVLGFQLQENPRRRG